MGYELCLYTASDFAYHLTSLEKGEGKGEGPMVKEEEPRGRHNDKKGRNQGREGEGLRTYYG